MGETLADVEAQLNYSPSGEERPIITSNSRLQSFH